jgi:hypothetical protein
MSRSLQISPAVDAHISTMPAEGDTTLDRVSALHQVLNQAGTSGSAREVVGAFAEAVAIWHDIEVRGYVENLRGEFVLDVALAGSDRTRGAAVIDQEFARKQADVARLSGDDAERLGFPSDADVLVAAFGERDKAWLIAFTGRIPAQDEARLALYIDLMREAVRHADAVATAQVSWAILQHLLVAPDDVDAAARGALGELATEMGASDSALIVTAANGMHVLSVGSAGVFSDATSGERGNQIASTTRVLDRYTVVLGVRRPEDREFLRRDRQTVDSAAAIFAPWLSGVLQRPAYGKDRRAARQRFEDVIDRMAAATARGGADVSVVVIPAVEAARRPGQVQQWVADMRGQLRAADLVGALTDNEVALLLSEATAADAARVVERLRNHLTANLGAGVDLPS